MADIGLQLTKREFETLSRGADTLHLDRFVSTALEVGENIDLAYWRSGVKKCITAVVTAMSPAPGFEHGSTRLELSVVQG